MSERLLLHRFNTFPEFVFGMQVFDSAQCDVRHEIAIVRLKTK